MNMTKDEKYLASLKIDSIARFNDLLKRKAFSPSNKYVQELRANLERPQEFPNNMPVAVDGGLGQVVMPQPQVDVAQGQRMYDQLVAEDQPLQDMSLEMLPMGKMFSAGLGRVLPGTTPVASQLGKRPLVKMDAIPEEQIVKRAADITKQKNLQTAIDESRRQANKQSILENQVKEELFSRNPKLRGQF